MNYPGFFLFLRYYLLDKRKVCCAECNRVLTQKTSSPSIRESVGSHAVPITQLDLPLTTRINKCLFNDFFRQHGAPELTSIFCALDSMWIDELHQPKYGVRFERPTTLAGGDDACRFQFSRKLN